jgi:hypothetical protein
MTKRAKYISQIVDELVELALCGTFLRVNIDKPLNDSPKAKKDHDDAKRIVRSKKINLKACFAEMFENNPEQAEALMADLKVKWETPAADPSENPS